MKKGDKIAILIIGFVIIISFIASFAYKNLNKGNEAIAIIKQEGKVIKEINLNKVKAPEQIKIPYKNGQYNTVSIETGRIKFIDASCHDKLCVKNGWLQKPGDISVCLPNKIMIKIQGEKTQVDEVTY